MADPLPANDPCSLKCTLFDFGLFLKLSAGTKIVHPILNEQFNNENQSAI
jgi:hypothetical protein